MVLVLVFNPLRTKGGSNLTPPSKNGFFNFRFFHVFKRNFVKELTQYINPIHILHLLCFLCILELHQLNNDWISKHSEDHLKWVGSERVKNKLHTWWSRFVDEARECCKDSESWPAASKWWCLEYTSARLIVSYAKPWPECIFAWKKSQIHDVQ